MPSTQLLVVETVRGRKGRHMREDPPASADCARQPRWTPSPPIPEKKSGLASQKSGPDPPRLIGFIRSTHAGAAITSAEA